MTSEELAKTHWWNGSQLYDAGQIEEAAAEWRIGLEVAPDHADLHNNLGVALWEFNQKKEAVAHWREAIRIRPDFFDPHYHLVRDLVSQLKAEESQSLWRDTSIGCRKALALNPDVPAERVYLLQLLGQAEWTLRNRRAALKAIEEAVALAPDNQHGYEWLMLIQSRMGYWRAMCRTIWTTAHLPHYERRPFGRSDFGCLLTALGIVVASGLLVWKLTRKQ